MKVYFAADHAAFDLKNQLMSFVHDELGMETEDCGAMSLDPNDDYPAIIASAASKLSVDALAGIDSRAIVAGGSGQGEAMVANRFPGVRCALYYGGAGAQIDASGNTFDMIASTRAHNDANALSLGGRFLSVQEAKDAVGRFLSAPFSDEDRHVRRIKQIEQIH